MDSRIEVRAGRVLNVTTYPHPANDATAILIHGLGGRGEQWHHQIQSLKTHFTVIVPDLYGHGKSKGYSTNNAMEAFSFNEMQQDVQALYTRYANKTTWILGHSYGGALATATIHQHPEHAQRLVLLCPLPCLPSVQTPPAYKLPAWLLEWFRPALEKEFAQLAFDKTTDPRLMRHEILASRANPMRMIKAMLCGMRDVPTLNLNTLTIPTLMILGEHDGIVPTAASCQYYKTLPQLTVETIAQTAHMPLLERPDMVNTLIRSLL